MKNNVLFGDFSPVSAKAWKQKIQVDLKGADYNETLIWESPEGIKTKPFYTREDNEQHLMENQTSPATWNIGEQIEVVVAKEANAKARTALIKGAEAIIFSLPKKQIDADELVKGIPTSVPIYLEFEEPNRALLTPFLAFQKSSKHNFFYNLDPIGHLARTGNWMDNRSKDLDFLKECLSKYPEFQILCVDLDLYDNAGANMVQQLAYAINHLNEYLLEFEPLWKINKSSVPVCFKVAVRGSYFFEIAKLRALRVLWKTIASEYGIENHCHILAVPSKRNKTLYDYNVNLLRTTTECMSAILGGANTVCNLPYDSLYHEPNEFGDRIARNQLLILKHESYFEKVNNPAEGAYYIEALTRELAEKALDLFKNIEASGGFLHQLSGQTIQRKIKESANREQEKFNSKKIVLLGTNKYPNEKDRMRDELQKKPFVEVKPRKTIIEPVITLRLAELIEQKRLEDE